MRQAEKKKQKDKIAIVLMLCFCVIALTSIFTIKSNLHKIRDSQSDVPVSEKTKHLRKPPRRGSRKMQKLPMKPPRVFLRLTVWTPGKAARTSPRGRKAPRAQILRNRSGMTVPVCPTNSPWITWYILSLSISTWYTAA